MGTDVPIQMTTVTRLVGTMGTGKWLFSCMNTQMNLQVKFLAAPIWTVWTTKRFFSCMSTVVYFHAILVECRVGAVGALMRLLGALIHASF